MCFHAVPCVRTAIVRYLFYFHSSVSYCILYNDIELVLLWVILIEVRKGLFSSTSWIFRYLFIGPAASVEVWVQTMLPPFRAFYISSTIVY